MIHTQLSTEATTELAACCREVLSVLDAPTTELWAKRVIARVQPLLRAERVFIVLPDHDGFSLHYSDNEMRAAAAAYQAHFHTTDVWTQARRRSLGLEVYSHDMLLRSGDERTEFWNDYILAHRLYQPAGLSCDVGGTPVPASIVGYKEKPRGRAFSHREMQMLHVLEPCFAAASGALRRFHHGVGELTSCIDRLAVPAILIGLSGVLHANAAFTHTLGSSLDAIVREITPAVLNIFRTRQGPKRQQVVGTVLGPRGRSIPWTVSLFSSFETRPMALVHFHVTPRLHLTDAMREHVGLTARQAAVAELMVDGRTYREIASILGIRPNTARRHWEQVLQRLGVNSKSEVRDAVLRNSGPIVQLRKIKTLA